MKRFYILTGTAIILILAAVGLYLALAGHAQIDKEDKKIVVASPHPIDFMRPLINEFESETGITVEIIKCGTTEAIDMMVEGKDVDLLWGGSVLSVGAYSDYFLPYTCANHDSFLPEFKDLGSGITGFTDVPSVLMINTDLIGDTKIEGYEDLLNPALRGKIAYADPGRSASSVEQLVKMLYAMGGGDPEKGWDYVSSFAGQLTGGLVSGSSAVYEGVSSGKYVVGLTFEEAAITMLKAGKHIKIVYMKEGVVSTPDGLYINKNAKNVDSAKAFVDFMTDAHVQKYISKNLGRRSVRTDVEASNLVSEKGSLDIIEVDRDLVIKSKKEWTDKFALIMGGDNE
ncbi:MAG: extracellular solute-binding protein [Butyrivibrio sp.]|nr:extracellular solute-binding protein [Butyrivibrio sp.]